uniref:Centrosomal protein 295 n=1 Tax=Catagonus wagneri TaxID=51154 RepID=A0A8C3VPW5_9CETA
LRECFPHLQDLAKDIQENIDPTVRSPCDDNQLLSEDSNAKQNGKPEFYQDRDPLRVSISREQSFLGGPLDHGPFGHLHPVAQENICGDDSDKPVKIKEAVVENQAVLSHAVEEEERTYRSPDVKPDTKTETQEIYHEPLSSITVSTGSFLSYENTDMSLTDPESFSEHMDYRKQEFPTGKEEETNILSSVVPSSQVIYQRQDSQDVHKPLLPAVETFTSGQTHIQQMDKYINEANLKTEKTDLRELEHAFPNLHRQLFKPLEPHPDFDLSSSFSGISQDSKDFYQKSDSPCESLHATLSPKSASFRALGSSSLHSLSNSLNQQPDPNLPHAAAQSFATENTEGSEQSFQQLVPEFSSREGSQHADLPSIFSIEARDSSQGMENQNYSSKQNEILQNKQKSVHFLLSVGNSQSSVFSSSGDADVFHQLNLQHSTPCGSTSSKCSIKDQPEGRKERLVFEELSQRGVDALLRGQGFIEDDKNENCGVLNINPHVEETDSQLCVRTVEMGTPIQTPYSLTVENEKCLNSTKAETPRTTGNLSQVAQSELFVNSGSFSLQSSVPVWETESGHGIMEEPELSMISTSDMSTAEMDFANLTLEEKENEAKNCFQGSEFLPLPSNETENSDHREHSVEKPTVSTETLSKFTATPGSLQEAFIKRKKSFIERSSQRQKEIRNKIRVSVNSQTKIVKEKLTGSFVSHLKGVTKVRVSFPEDRKTAQTHMHQRALRLYHQLPEMKHHKEEKAKQDAYAQNRTRAKEFHKKTLEKLRAKNIC